MKISNLAMSKIEIAIIVMIILIFAAVGYSSYKRNEDRTITCFNGHSYYVDEAGALYIRYADKFGTLIKCDS